MARPSATLPLALLTLAVVALIGLANLAQPFTWDQAVFALGAEVLARGGTLYRDYWDLKQPGIFGFFWLAARLFGSSEAGAHTLELAWALALALVLQRSLRRWFAQAATAACAPLLAVALPQALMRDWHLLQVEDLVGLPLFLAVWLAVPPGETRRWPAPRAFAAGFAGGVVTVFKLALAPVFGGVWLYALVRAARAVPATPRAALAPAGALVAGFALAWAPVLGLLAAHGVLGEAWRTWVELPARLIAEMPRGLAVDALGGTARWVLTSWWPVLIPGLAGAVMCWRAREPFGRALVLWLLFGFAAILAQRWSGYEYHFLLLAVPLGLLATRALEALAAAVVARWPARTGRVAFSLALLLWFAAPLARASGKLGDWLAARAWTDPAATMACMERASGNDAYRHYRLATEFLHAPEALPGPIYVFGNPLAYWLSGRVPAAARPGGMSVFDGAEWGEVARDLLARRPPYILVEDPAHDMLLAHRPATAAVLAVLRTHYRHGTRVHDGEWFELASSPGEEK